MIEREVVPRSIDKYDTGDIGILPVMRPEIGEIRPGQPAAASGLEPGDRIVKAEGEPGVQRERVIELIK